MSPLSSDVICLMGNVRAWVGSQKSHRLLGVLLLFAAVGWAVWIQAPTLEPGYLNAGDDHIHVAYANELVRIWEGEGRWLGWSRLYAAGAPIFVLRPPGFYTAVAATHLATGLTVEQSLKLVVLFGFALFPLSVFIGSRLLGLGFWPAVFSGVLSPLAISLWGHSLEAYQYLGIHKQLLAILLFPVALGSLWRMLQRGEYGWLFALSFPAMFMTHPYIAFCLVLTAPLMLISLATMEPTWNWRRGLGRSVVWSIPAFLLLCLWLIPFVFSTEAQVFDPYLSRRNYFEVVVSTTAETLRQLFLGGILDTTRFAGPFGGTEWAAGAEWGWRDNSAYFRLPVLTLFALLGAFFAVFRPRSAAVSFVGLVFLFSLVLFMGPDDFPWIDWIPLAIQYQNIHGVFILEWAAFVLGGVALYRLAELVRGLPIGCFRCLGAVAAALLVLVGLGTAYWERTRTGANQADVRNIYTANGRLNQRPGMFRQWAEFAPVVEILRSSKMSGAVATLPQQHDDSVLYNLLPLMADRSVYISGFEKAGGIYDLLLHEFRGPLRDHYRFQRQFNIRYVLNSPFYRKEPLAWHRRTQELYASGYWELRRVGGDFGPFDALPPHLVGFLGSEREWALLMKRWLQALRDSDAPLPSVVDLSTAADLEALRPFVGLVVLGQDGIAPEGYTEIPRVTLDGLGSSPLAEMRARLLDNRGLGEEGALTIGAARFASVHQRRDEERFFFEGGQAARPLLFKRMFYRGWRVEIDGEPAPLYRVSPGLQMILLPPGSHEVVWRYHGPNQWGWAKGAFGLGLLLIVVLTLMGWHRAFGVPAPDLSKRRHGAWIPMVIWFAFVGVFVQKTVAEVWQLKPVVISPQDGAQLRASNQTFFWNYLTGLPGAEQRFRLQLAADAEFETVLEEKEVDGSQGRFDYAFQAGEDYFYRIRLESHGGPHPWSGPFRFQGAQE